MANGLPIVFRQGHKRRINILALGLKSLGFAPGSPSFRRGGSHWFKDAPCKFN